MNATISQDDRDYLDWEPRHNHGMTRKEAANAAEAYLFSPAPEPQDVGRRVYLKSTPAGRFVGTQPGSTGKWVLIVAEVPAGVSDSAVCHLANQTVILPTPGPRRDQEYAVVAYDQLGPTKFVRG